MWFTLFILYTLYPMIGPIMSDQKGNPNISFVIGYQNVPGHRIQENFPALAPG